MAAQKEDRRIRRTKRLLRQALAEIMNEKDFKDITVKEITDRADLNRGTFYFHYTDTYDLRNQIEDELVEELKEAIAEFQPEQAEFSLRPMLKKVFDYVLSQKFLFRTFFRSSSNSGLQNKVMAVVEENIDNARSELEVNESERSRKYHSRFMSSGSWAASISGWKTAMKWQWILSSMSWTRCFSAFSKVHKQRRQWFAASLRVCVSRPCGLRCSPPRARRG